MSDRASLGTHAHKRHARPDPVRCSVIGRTAEKIRLRALANHQDLFAAGNVLDELELAIGDIVLVEASFDDGEFQVVAAEVIGLPGAGVVEIETRGAVDGKPKSLLIKKGEIGGHT